MNLVEQIFEQAKLGTAPDPNANPFAEGMRIGVARQHADIAKQQLALEIAQVPLKQTLLAQDAAMNQAKLQDYLQSRQAEADAGLAFAALRGKVDPLLRAGKLDEAQNLIITEGADNGLLLADPKKRLQTLYEMTTKAQDAKLELLRARTANSSFIPEEVLVPSKVPGQPPTRVLRKGPNTAEVLDTEAEALRKKALDLQAQRLQKALPDAAKAELRDIYEQIKSKRAKLDELPEMTGMVWNRQPNPKRAALQKEIDDLKAQAKSLEGAPSAAAPAAPDSFETGVTYTDANGNKAVYRGNGKWEPVP